jgi:secreted PhoX family phosphatase
VGDGGWYYVSNCETVPGSGGGVSSIRFASDGTITGAQRVATGNRNCAGGATPWGTWLSCEEVVDGRVWEVDPTGTVAAAVVPALGTFQKEAACVDPVREQIYQTEDVPDGCFYRFTPDAYPDLSAGKLEVAIVAGDNSVTWGEVPLPNQVNPTRTKDQVAGATRFAGGEGIWYDEGLVYFTTKGDRKVWIYNAVTSTIEVLYDLAQANADTPLREVDNITVSKSGDLYVCEDGDNFELCIITPDRYISTFLRLDPAVHGAPGSNETSGVAFDPSGARMYVAGQRSFGAGAIYEISGPFRVTRPADPVVVPKPDPEPTDTTTTAPPAVVPPPVVPPGPPADRIAPGVRLLSLVKSLTTRRMLTRGLSVLLQIDEPAGIELVLRAPGFGVLAQRRTTVAVAGRVRLRLRPARATVKRKLRRRKRVLRATLTVTVRDAAGNTRTARRTVKLTPPRG